MTRAEKTVSGIGRREFEGFRRLIRDVSGIALADSKDALLSARVARRMRSLGITDHADYYNHVVSDDSGMELCLLIDAISTNVTHFFREAEHFTVLANHLEKLDAAGRQEARLWCAACATGEEPYTMAMVARETLSSSPMRVRILATDISGEALDVARRGVYPVERMRNMPKAYQLRYMKRARDGEYEVTPYARNLVTLARINLSSPPFPMSGPFDCVFCRNVMIYFGKDTRQALISEIARLMAPGGLLMLGHAESLAGIDTPLVSVAPSTYRKPGGVL